MTGLESMKLRTEISGSSIRMEKILDARRMELFDNENDPSYNPNIYSWVAGENPHKGEQKHLRLYNQSFSAANGGVIKFQSLYDEPITVGDYIYDEGHDVYWICTEMANVDDIHYSGKFTQCNWILKWQAPDGRILEYPIQDMNATQYNSGETATTNLTLGSAQHIATVRATEDTITLASPRRFYLSRSYTIPFVVTQNDTVAYNYGNGLCKITLTQDLNIDENDRPDLGICDYIPSLSKKEHHPHHGHKSDIRYKISGGATLKCTKPKSWSVSITDKYGNEVEDCDFSWNVISDFNMEQNIDNKTIQLMTDDESVIGSQFALQVIVDGCVMAEQDITVVDLL